jgi:hypothetical protein
MAKSIGHSFGRAQIVNYGRTAGSCRHENELFRVGPRSRHCQDRKIEMHLFSMVVSAEDETKLVSHCKSVDGTVQLAATTNFI